MPSLVTTTEQVYADIFFRAVGITNPLLGALFAGVMAVMCEGDLAKLERLDALLAELTDSDSIGQETWTKMREVQDARNLDRESHCGGVS